MSLQKKLFDDDIYDGIAENRLLGVNQGKKVE